MTGKSLSTDQDDDDILLEQLLEAIGSDSSRSLVELLDPLSLIDALRIILLLKLEEIERVLYLLPPEFAAKAG